MQILGSGKLSKALTVKAAAFSESAKAAIEAAGGTIELVPQQAKWTRKAYNKAKAANPEYEADKLKAKIASLVAKVRWLGWAGLGQQRVYRYKRARKAACLSIK